MLHFLYSFIHDTKAETHFDNFAGNSILNKI